MYLRDDHKASLKWTFTGGKIKGSNEYLYNKVEFTINGDDLVCCFFCTSPAYLKANVKKKRTFRLRNFRSMTAGEARMKHSGPDGWGRVFEDGIIQVYHDLGLPLYKRPELRDPT